MLSRFLIKDQVGHETTHACSGNEHFSPNNVTVRPTKIVSRQTLGTFLTN